MDLGLGLDLVSGWSVVLQTYLYYFPFLLPLSRSCAGQRTDIFSVRAASKSSSNRRREDSFADCSPTSHRPDCHRRVEKNY